MHWSTMNYVVMPSEMIIGLPLNCLKKELVLQFGFSVHWCKRFLAIQIVKVTVLSSGLAKQDTV